MLRKQSVVAALTHSGKGGTMVRRIPSNAISPQSAEIGGAACDDEQ
jgi:hypothetical protein